ncbi:MAG TPA: hemerythrin domain-containing protein [Usitatibacter sp.]|nr:hemerythrin domain-containing protein [Usitatibacter sp.]
MPKSKAPDAIALLIGDHRKVAGLFKQFKKAKGPRKSKLAHEICLELSVHTMIEETLFYPALRGQAEDDTLDEALVEHDSAKVIISDILGNRVGSQFYDAKMQVLSELIKHHVNEEEQRGGLFTQARKSKVDLVALREKLEARKEALVAKYKRGIPTPVVRAIAKPKVKAGKPVGG